jgi:FAD/FMN-containing dehydrogenase/Fe-S oxidoreductase
MPSDLELELARRFSGELRFDLYSRILYATDASNYQIEPIGVGFPRTDDDVQYALEVCARHRVPLLARGGGSSLAGQAVGHALILDFSKHLNHIVEINPDEGWAVCEPGVVCDTLSLAAKKYNLMVGTDPASSNRATLGGMVMNNATGAHSVLYGMTADHLIAAEVFLADGAAATFSETDSPPDLLKQVRGVVDGHAEAIRACYPKTWRRSSGYALNYLLPYTATQPHGWDRAKPYPLSSPTNLVKLLAGSEGTLAVLHRLKINLVPRPKKTALCILHFDSVAQASDATPPILESSPSAVELVDRMMIDLTRQIPSYARLLTWVQGQPGAVLIVEFYGDTDAELIAKVEALEARKLASASVRALTPEEQGRVWGVRKVGLGLLMGVRGDAKPLAFMEDVAVPVERLGEYVREVERIFAAEGVASGYYAHASAGCLHIRPVISLKQQSEIDRMKRIAEAVFALVKCMGGSMSGEHGDGLSRSCWNERLYGPEVYQAFKEIKKIFDPDNILNPGKVIASQNLDENLRYGVAYKTIPVQTHFDFTLEQGFAGAVEQCNGAGVCRKADGVMCPSFMATREEEHSTRGRANALRAALSGHLPPEHLTSERMHAVLDLCLECKACKAECPSGVDMAKIKYEFLAQYNDRHGVSLRSRFFANIEGLSRMAYRMSPLVNVALSLPLVRWLNEKLLGVSRHRLLPRFAAKTFRQLFWKLEVGDWKLDGLQSPISNLQSSIVLFDDTFTNYNHPPVGLAAVRVLAAAGYRPVLVPKVCCGRPMISKGLLEQARANARRNIEVLAPYAERGVPIVGLEPSCLLTLRDEYLDLLPNDPRAKLVAQHSFLIEEFIAARADEFRPLFNLQSLVSVLFHGHCYQKALTSTEALKVMLRLTGAEVGEIDSGCCGMAGSFGYEVEHYDLSMRIGEERLLPAVRAARTGTILAASGMSCRHQIAAGTNREVKHPIEVMAAFIT